MEISEREFKKLVNLVGRLNSTVELATKKINQYSKNLEEQSGKLEALTAQVEKLLKGKAAGGN